MCFKCVLFFVGCVVLQFAVKMIKKKRLNSAREKFHIQREIDIQSKLRHPHIISVYEGLCEKNTNLLFLGLASSRI